MARKTSILAFGARADAGTWEKQCRAQGFDIGRVIRKSYPVLDELRDLFAVPAAWLYFGGHFGSLMLLNDKVKAARSCCGPAAACAATARRSRRCARCSARTCCSVSPA